MDAENTRGKLVLQFKKYRDETRMTSQFYRLPLQVLPPHYQDKDGTAFVYLLNPSGGVLQGDRFHVELKLDKGASVVATTPSSGKFYRMEEGDAVVDNVFYLEQNAILEYMPGHSVPFAGTNAEQNNEFHIKESSILFTVDTVSSGRKARGESFAYQRFCSRTSIYVGKELVLYDCVDIKPEEERFNEIGILEGQDIFSGIYVYKRGAADEARRRILESFPNIEDIRFGVTAVDEDLLTVRILAADVIRMQEAIEHIWDITRHVILDKPAVRIRKY